MHPAVNWQLGAEYLSEVEPLLTPYITKYGPCTLRPQPQERYFEILVNALLSRQVSPSSFALIKAGLATFCPSITPESILTVTMAEWLSLQVSTAKAEHIMNLAKSIVQGQIDLAKLDTMTDSALKKYLLQVKGLGEWTVGMFQILAMGRPDIFLPGDYIFSKSYQTLFALPALPSNALLRKGTAPWSPWRTLGIWYLWQAYAANSN